MENADLYMLDKTTVGSRLHNWAKWKLSTGASLGYPPSSAFTKLKVDCQRTEDLHIDFDKECTDTDKAVERLPYLHHVIIRVEYMSGYQESAVKAHKCGISKRTYYNYLEQAKEMVANNLNNILHYVHTSGINVVCG